MSSNLSQVGDKHLMLRGLKMHCILPFVQNLIDIKSYSLPVTVPANTPTWALHFGTDNLNALSQASAPARGQANYRCFLLLKAHHTIEGI